MSPTRSEFKNRTLENPLARFMHSGVPTMSSGIQLRLLALGLSLAVLGALIVVVVLSSQRQASELRARLSQVDVESFSIAEQFKDRLRGVTDKMRSYRTTHDPGAWEAFLQASHEL